MSNKSIICTGLAGLGVISAAVSLGSSPAIESSTLVGAQQSSISQRLIRLEAALARSTKENQELTKRVRALEDSKSQGEVLIAGLRDQLDNLSRDISGVQDVRGALNSLANRTEGLNEDVANVRRLADTFQKELQQVGMDTETLKRDLTDVSDRAVKLEGAITSAVANGEQAISKAEKIGQLLEALAKAVEALDTRVTSVISRTDLHGNRLDNQSLKIEAIGDRLKKLESKEADEHGE